MSAALPSGRRGVCVVACLLVFILVAIPTVDLVAFGIHEHTATVDPEGDSDDVTQTSHAGHVLSHHCDLSMSPGEVATHFDLLSPLGTAVTIVELPSLHVCSLPFVPFSPPRS